MDGGVHINLVAAGTAEFRGADSMLLLVEALRRVRAAGWDVGNLDSTIIAQAPRLAAHIPLMRERITQALELQQAVKFFRLRAAESSQAFFEHRRAESGAKAVADAPTPKLVKASDIDESSFSSF